MYKLAKFNEQKKGKLLKLSLFYYQQLVLVAPVRRTLNPNLYP